MAYTECTRSGKNVASSLPQTGEGARPHTSDAGEKRQARAPNYKPPAANYWFTGILMIFFWMA